MPIPVRPGPLGAALLFAALLAAGGAPAAANTAADIYQAAVASPSRPAADRKRDAIDHPADILRLAEIKPGTSVGDYLAADGYYSELLSSIVGPTGHVLLLNNAAYDHWSNNGWKPRLAGGRLPNVEHRTVDVEHLDIPDSSLDALLGHQGLSRPLLGEAEQRLAQDRHRSGAQGNGAGGEARRRAAAGRSLRQTGHGPADAGRIHRIDEAYAQRDFENHGFRLIAKSDVLRHPEDPRDQITFEGPMVGKTDRFVMVFRRG